MEKKKALIVGASGLVGGHCLQALLASSLYESVVSLGRRRLPLDHPKLTQHLIDFDRAAQTPEFFACDDAFCCLGTTIKQAGSQENFRKVDHGYVTITAQLAQQQGATRFFVVSALGADATSLIPYTRVKGNMEAQLQQFGFEELYIFRPSLLVGDRQEERKAEKTSERVLNVLEPLMTGSLRKYQAIRAHTVGEAMVRAAAGTRPGVHIFFTDQIKDLVNATPAT
ncbi:Uncharacterized conserved protein YbjT, contains NAD(P)-binding and DUF2867 domains [Catalinimonas alkaloidigena]|uniref:Uncharacterized conserved protein YbjT, contains NAD(P)-binding and DUF2867 domains n=1 Tax=Catalinimonas alkaloidigena TaxID=1075417 RepID=A0A1G8XKP6_9BACT|nr:oxidoreductase [Catalinimonas alkaloidigena]SDJ90977.1 Uncharacterized conserved protein YbjT, contains NAD(P)-binding and DUF2867 domains [Catalinimonas alkaloidigena]